MNQINKEKLEIRLR